MPIVSLTKKDSMQYTVYYSKLAFYSVHSLKNVLINFLIDLTIKMLLIKQSAASGALRYFYTYLLTLFIFLSSYDN